MNFELSKTSLQNYLRNRNKFLQFSPIMSTTYIDVCLFWHPWERTNAQLLCDVLTHNMKCLHTWTSSWGGCHSSWSPWKTLINGNLPCIQWLSSVDLRWHYNVCGMGVYLVTVTSGWAGAEATIRCASRLVPIFGLGAVHPAHLLHNWNIRISEYRNIRISEY